MAGQVEHHEARSDRQAADFRDQARPELNWVSAGPISVSAGGECRGECAQQLEISKLEMSTIRNECWDR